MKAHLLYVEDDESLSFVTRDNLELQGYQITHCATGKDALQLIDAQSVLKSSCSKSKYS